MNHIGTVPMRTRPLSYQPLRAGQFRGYGGCNVFPSRTTIVNNNIYGGYGFDSGCCGGYNDGGMSKGMKWMMGLGITLPLVGSILSALGLGGGKKVEDGQGGEQPPANDQSDLIKDLTKQVENLTATVEDLKNGKKEPEVNEPTAATVKEEEPASEAGETSKIDFSKFKDGEIMNCVDNGGPRPINGKLSNVQTNEKGVPTSFTITDTTENKKGNTYEYVLASTADDGTPTYKCVKKNNQAVIGEQVYAFKDGKLVQENNGFKGFGVGIKTAADNQKPPVNVTPKNEEVPEGTMKDEVSNKYSSLTPYFNKKDGKWHSTPDQDHSYRDLSYSASNINKANNVNTIAQTVLHGDTNFFGNPTAKSKEQVTKAFNALSDQEKADTLQHYKNQGIDLRNYLNASTPTNIGKNAVADAYNKITSKGKNGLSKAYVLAEMNRMSAADKKSLADQLTKAGYGEFL